MLLILYMSNERKLLRALAVKARALLFSYFNLPCSLWFLKPLEFSCSNSVQRRWQIGEGMSGWGLFAKKKALVMLSFLRFTITQLQR